MFREFLMLLLLAHVLGDFYMQTERLAKKKQERIRWVLLHALLYWMASLLAVLPFLSWPVLLFSSISAGSHLLIDVLKYAFLTRNRRLPPAGERKIFFFDQLLHLFFIAILAFLFAAQGEKLLPIPIVTQMEAITKLPMLTLLAWVTAILLAHKPANLAISRVLEPYKPSVEKEGTAQPPQGDRNAGRFIGTLERLIIIVLLSRQQYAAIGLVLTAKSVARYDKITKDAAFAEYYLLGTLLSTLLAMIISCML